MVEGDLERDGFCLLRRAVDADTVAHLLNVFCDVFEDDSDNVRARSSRGHVYAARNLIETIPEVSTVWQSDALLRFLREQLGDDVGLVRALFFDKPPDRTWALACHKGTSVAVMDNSIPSPSFSRPTTKAGVPHMIASDDVLRQMLTLRIHLDEVTDENGPLRVIPGSHVSCASVGVGMNAAFDVHASAGDVLATRRIDAIFPIVFLDGIVIHIRGASGRVSEHTMYVAIGVNFRGKKALFGLWLSENEGAKFWHSCLTDLRNRGLSDMFIVCVDGLSGFPEAIRSAYPKAQVQLCIAHLVRAALRYVNDSDSREVIADLKKIYQAASVLEAETELENFSKKWDAKYLTISKRLKWPHISEMFELPMAIRKATYATNMIESVNSVIRKFTRNRKQYPNRESALKLIYMAIHKASKRWTMPIRKWKEALNHFAILFEGRMPKNLD